MAGFPAGRESANFKLAIPSDAEKPIVRTYTVRNFDEARQEVDVDFFIAIPALFIANGSQQQLLDVVGREWFKLEHSTAADERNCPKLW